MRALRSCLCSPSLMMAMLIAGSAHAQLIVFSSPLSSADVPVTSTVSTRYLPGEFRERQLASESNLQLRPGLNWQTTTGLSGARYEQAMLFRNQSARLTTGPQLRWGLLELALPVQAGHEAFSSSGETQWATGMPRMTVQLGPNDSIRLEARAGTRSEHASTRSSRSRKSVELSWRHTFNDKFSLRTGLERSRETIDHSLEVSEGAQAFAQFSASLPNHWRLVFGGNLHQVVSRSALLDDAVLNRTQALSLSANRALLNGWKLSGSLSVSQKQFGDGSAPTTARTGNLRLTRDF